VCRTGGWIFYSRTLDGSPPQVISQRCAAVNPQLPCLKDVKQESDGDFTAILVQDHNGFMH
jgi:hypothetical protein